MTFSISVIIPVYNAEDFIKKTIASVLIHPEVKEIVLVNDGSIDGSLLIIEELKKSDDRIQIFHHEGAVNKGRSASRNLGITKARFNYISFLDADDFYLENRFERDKELLQDQLIDGTYNAVGFHLYRNINAIEAHHFKVATLKKAVVPELLFENIVSSKLGYLHLNGITVKRSVFDIIGFFNVDLKVAEDSDLIFKLSLKTNLVASSIDTIVAKRGVHETNIFNQDDIYENYNVMLYESMIDWGTANNIQLEKIELLVNTLWVVKFRHEANMLSYIAYWMRLQIKWPRLFGSYLSIKYFPLVRLRKQLFPSMFK
ncbi:glycosyltransferase family 2 protein [uncultured Dokdonia sp.]|uniref:glycosyltransferase family 2 protein n=1 Tax=uncultured Dokdonia sp. TaxID=575653 RepID=UPI0030EBB4E8|tara:strand:+ start:52684 stop:53628 length:945 start_codon:yes stop_codon:yes gene_type:complete